MRLLDMHKQVKEGEQQTNDEITKNWADFLESAHTSATDYKQVPSPELTDTTVRVRKRKRKRRREKKERERENEIF